MDMLLLHYSTQSTMHGMTQFLLQDDVRICFSTRRDGVREEEKVQKQGRRGGGDIMPTLGGN